MKIKAPDGKEYEVDIERAKNIGLCKEIRPEIISFRVGDVFKSNGGLPVFIIQSEYFNHTYAFAGLDGLELFSNISPSLTKREMVEYLNKNKYKLLGNINSDIRKLISAYVR